MLLWCNIFLIGKNPKTVTVQKLMYDFVARASNSAYFSSNNLALKLHLKFWPSLQ